MQLQRWMALVAGVVLAGASQPAVAAPWQVGMAPGIFEIPVTSQTDETGAYTLSFDCSTASGITIYSLAVVEPEPWDETASYAPEVPTTFETPAGSREIDFYFNQRAGAQAVVTYEDPVLNGEFFDYIRDAMRNEAPIRVRYFNRDLTFAGDGAGLGLIYLVAFCGPGWDGEP